MEQRLSSSNALKKGETGLKRQWIQKEASVWCTTKIGNVPLGFMIASLAPSLMIPTIFFP